MTYQAQSFTKRLGAVVLAALTTTTIFAAFTFDTYAQDAPRVRDKNDLGDNPNRLRSSIELAGYTRPGTPPDEVNAEGKIVAPDFKGKDPKKFKYLGASVYFAVFKNTGTDPGDTFGTGMPDFDRRFEAGVSFQDTDSPRLDKKARYLYLYQIVNDRFLNLRLISDKAQKGDGVKNPLFNADFRNKLYGTIPTINPIHQFSVTLRVDPRYLTSWGHFRDSGFVANVVDLDTDGKPVKHVVDDGGKKVERDREIRLAFSAYPSITLKLPRPAFVEKAKPHSLGDLETGFGVGASGLNLKKSKTFEDLKLIAAQVGKVKDEGIKWTAFLERVIKAADAGREPDFVQVTFPKVNPNDPFDPNLLPLDERRFSDELASATFQVNWRLERSLKPGERSVLVGFTTDLPPTFDAVQQEHTTDEKGLEITSGPGNQSPADRLGGLRGAEFLTSFRNDAEGLENPEAFSFTQGGTAPSTGAATGTVPTPTPPGPPPAGGGGGGGGVSAPLGGGSGGGGSSPGGLTFPTFAGGFSRPTGASGGGGAVAGGGGTGNGNGQPGSGSGQGNGTGQGNGNAQGSVIVNFDASLLNQQNQNQQQQQQQKQQQYQNQNQNNNHDHNHHHHNNRCGSCDGHVVPAPASLLLGLLGLPAFWFLRRRKPGAEEVVA